MRDVSSESNKERTGKSEAVSSKRCLSFNLISPYTLERMALRKTVGKDKYGSVQWRIGINDAEYVTDRFNHFFQHLMDFMKEGNKHDDNIGGMLWGLECLSEVERLAPDALKHIIGICDLFDEDAKRFHTNEQACRSSEKIAKEIKHILIEPRFHTAKDTQIDTKSPDGTSEHWYIIDTVGKRRVRVYSNERLTAADRAAIECRNFNNGTNPDILTSWEPFPAI